MPMHMSSRLFPSLATDRLRVFELAYSITVSTICKAILDGIQLTTTRYPCSHMSRIADWLMHFRAGPEASKIAPGGFFAIVSALYNLKPGPRTQSHEHALIPISLIQQACCCISPPERPPGLNQQEPHCLQPGSHSVVLVGAMQEAALVHYSSSRALEGEHTLVDCYNGSCPWPPWVCVGARQEAV